VPIIVVLANHNESTIVRYELKVKFIDLDLFDSLQREIIDQLNLSGEFLKAYVFTVEGWYLGWTTSEL